MKFKVIGIGEVLWDLLPSGRRLGGAPANFAYHAAALGANARVISRVGDDALGREIIDSLVQLGLPTDGIEIDPVAPTGRATVELGADGQPSFIIHENVAWDHLDGTASLRFASEADAVSFGTLAQRSEPSRKSIHALLMAARQESLRILDLNLRQKYFSLPIIEQSLRMANVVKLNEDELRYIASEFKLTGSDRLQLEQLAGRFHLRVVALTRGDRGSLLFAGGEFVEHAGLKTVVVDTIGAGDSFTASLAMGLLYGWPLERISDVAMQVAAHVCSCSGATPALPPTLRNMFPQDKR